MPYKILEITGYYRIKKSLKHKLFCRRLLKEDALRKRNTLKALDQLHGNQLSRKSNEEDLIVSLTSYGVRVSDTLPYTLYSLLQQTKMPNRIVVWLDNVNWNDDNLPEPLKKCKELGVEYYYVEDIRSYKKLIPALKMFPDNVIITVDDDLYYNSQIVEWLWDAYEKSDKRTVLGTWAYCAKEENGNYLPYSQWKDNTDNTKKPEYSLIGCGGILYPPKVFDDEIVKKELFMELAPTADDLWFWIMEKRKNIKVDLIPNAGYGLNTAVNRIDVWEPNKEGSLYFINEINGKNDKQFIDLVRYYNIKP